jgi:hypothetical protein
MNRGKVTVNYVKVVLSYVFWKATSFSIGTTMKPTHLFISHERVVKHLSIFTHMENQNIENQKRVRDALKIVLRENNCLCKSSLRFNLFGWHSTFWFRNTFQKLNQIHNLSHYNLWKECTRFVLQFFFWNSLFMCLLIRVGSFVKLCVYVHADIGPIRLCW